MNHVHVAVGKSIKGAVGNSLNPLGEIRNAELKVIGLLK
ncbi:hypothetical protein QE429_004222 [Bacillus sp. SORGH_AS 510]|nr:hypothetical protein [Bacillus sp. SORGH_AS_0510]